MNAKPWYQSKTLWANILAAVGLFVNMSAESEVIPAEVLAALTVIINFVLRLLTSRPIDTGKKPPLGSAAIALLVLCMVFANTGCSSTRAPAGYTADTTPEHNGELWIGAADDPGVPEGRDIKLHAEGDARAVPMIGGANTPEASQAPNRSAVRVEVTPDSVSTGFDLLGMKYYRASDWARKAWGPLKILSYPADYVGYMVTEHPFQSLAVGLAAWELTDNGVSNTLGGLFGDDSSSSSSSDDNSNAPSTATESTLTGNVEINGDNNVVSFTTTNASTAEAPRESSTTTTNNLER